jgi:uncharacterized membrane protein YfcA
MELLVNSVIGWGMLIIDGVRGLFEWADKALVVALAVAIGAYLGTRVALNHYDGPVPARAVPER